MKLAIILGTEREGRRSEKAAKYIEKVAQEKGHETIFIDPRTYHFEADGNNEECKRPKYSHAIEEADALFIITPEYNHSFPGTLKRMLDTAYAEYKKKPVALAGVSTGDFGGVRAIEQLNLVLKTFGTVHVKDVPIPHIKDSITEDLEATSDKVSEGIDSAIDELEWFAKALNWAKENL